jgi:hypothetical protein
MRLFLGAVVFVLAAWLIATTRIPRPPSSRPCSTEWLSYIDRYYFDISDGQGHGPDLGSREWLDSVGRKLKLPEDYLRSDQDRCGNIQRQLERHTYVINSALGISLSF